MFFVEKIIEILPGLVELRVELQQISELQPLDGIVRFFNEVSKWHDRKAEVQSIVGALKETNYGQYDEMLNKLQDLQIEFEQAGRQEYGWNRTKVGETVTPDNVFLGDIFGLWTKTAAFWKTTKDDPKDAWQGTCWAESCKGMNSYDVISMHVKGFMAWHTRKISDLITGIQVVGLIGGNY